MAIELVCCSGSGLDCVPLGLEMLVRESLRCGEGQGGCGLGKGSQEAAPGLAVCRGKSQSYYWPHRGGLPGRS